MKWKSKDEFYRYNQSMAVAFPITAVYQEAQIVAKIFHIFTTILPLWNQPTMQNLDEFEENDFVWGGHPAQIFATEAICIIVSMNPLKLKKKQICPP